MTDYSTKQQRMKRQIFNFVKKVSGGLKRPEQKFSIMVPGIRTTPSQNIVNVV